MTSLAERIADELGVRPAQVEATVRLLDEGATVPFIARYRKEVTGSLDDIQLRALDERLRYLRELDDRRLAILGSIEEQGKLTPTLKSALLQAQTKQLLEDLYLPYKPKRRTKAQIAREAGLQPLADSLLANPRLSPEAEAAQYLLPATEGQPGVPDVKAALEGAKQILMEQFAEDAGLLGKLRDFLWQEAQIKVLLVPGKAAEGAKYSDYFDHCEALHKLPPHRAMAIFRGRKEGMLNYSLVLDEAAEQAAQHPCEQQIAAHWQIRDANRPADAWLREVVRWTWKIKLYPHLESELTGQVREAAEADAIKVFANNLKDLLLSAPAGPRATLGLDPGLRTGVKVAIIDATGKVAGYGAIFPHAPQNQWAAAKVQIRQWCQTHRIELIAIGNGTASRETEKLVAEVCRECPELKLSRVMVNESGASVYSASEYASRELPELDVTIRGAVSIARRLQDPLAELVKIEPKSIGVGQYQHDVSQLQLTRNLDVVVEDCVNAVGVDLNTASVPLLAHVSGLNSVIARNIVAFRESNGTFRNRRMLLKVPRLGEKSFEQAAGFLRIMQGDNPLDASAVHPEAYPLVEQIACKVNLPLADLIGNSSLIRSLRAEDFVSERYGLPTVRDILAELEKPGRDPRPEFRFASFQEGVDSLKDLKVGMLLEGCVTNVANFGAFVDIGVHQDGLVHISALSNSFVKDPRSVVKAGDIVKVKVLEVDTARKRIALTMRLQDETGSALNAQASPAAHAQKNTKKSQQPAAPTGMASALAQALAAAKVKR